MKENRLSILSTVHTQLQHSMTLEMIEEAKVMLIELHVEDDNVRACYIQLLRKEKELKGMKQVSPKDELIEFMNLE